jgi:RimJ/RimL family protein N-acetyltransferase
VLQGEKVTLRPLRREDAEIMCRFCNDVEVELAGGGDPPMPHTLEGWQAWYDEHIVKNEKDHASFAIEADGKCIGLCGLWRFDTTSRTCELGITIGERNYWGRGYGRDAVRLLLDYAFRLRNLRKVCLTTSSTNVRAQRCYLACGFVEEGRLRAQNWTDGQYVDQVHMGILSEEWERQK